MVRRCAVLNCSSTDLTILCHRFPKNPLSCLIWQENLQLMDHPIDELLSKFVVCTKHFEASDYKNVLSNALNLTAAPKLQLKSQNRLQNHIIENNLIELSSQNLDNSVDFGQFNGDKINAQLNSDDDIMILSEDNIIQFDGDEPDQSKSLIQSVDLTDFHKVNMLDLDTMCIPAGSDLNDISFIGNTSPLKFIDPQTSDSEVEVLFFDEMIDHQSAFSIDEEHQESSISEISPPSFDVEPRLDVYSADFGCQVNLNEFEEDDLYKNFTRAQLIQHIGVQNVQINELKESMETFQRNHTLIAQSIDTIRNLMNSN